MSPAAPRSRPPRRRRGASTWAHLDRRAAAVPAVDNGRMPETSLPVEFLFHLALTLGERHVLKDGPQGSRVVVRVTGGSFEGPRLKGTVLEPGGDWVSARSDGTFKLDVRLMLRTDDDALGLMTYNGLLVRGREGPATPTAPLFE